MPGPMPLRGGEQAEDRGSRAPARSPQSAPASPGEPERGCPAKLPPRRRPLQERFSVGIECDLHRRQLDESAAPRGSQQSSRRPLRASDDCGCTSLRTSSTFPTSSWRHAVAYT
eukprot:scaffold317_cov260-Pinguiococcus_pyrenoidosus.AAC.45